jgi:hypothetical protein
MDPMPKKNGKAQQKRLTRLQVMLSEDELTALDNFRFQKRMPTRAAAVREILQRGLAAVGFEFANPEMHSSEFGIIRETAASKSRGPGAR